VEQEAAKELIDRQSHDPLLISVGGVAPTEGDAAVGKSNQPAVGDGDAVGISAEIAQHIFWATERRFGVDNPVVTEQYPPPRSEGARFRQRQEMSVELECGGLKSGLESGNKLAAKDPAEHLNGKEERVARMDPVGAIQ